MTGNLEDRIRRRAHEIWEHAGQPDGRNDEHWEQACRELAAEDAATGREFDVEPNLSAVAAGRMEATGSPQAPLSPGAANSSRMAKTRRKDAT